MTIVAALWGRVEMQMLRYYPRQFLLHRNLGPGRGVEDYTQMMPHMVLIRSLRQRHFLVFMTAWVSILLKILIAMCPSIFYLAQVQEPMTVEVEVLDSFDIDSNITTNKGAWVTAELADALGTFNVTPALGVIHNMTYQTFRTIEDGEASRGTIESPLTLDVDVISTDVDCLELTNYKLTMSENKSSINFDLQFGDCNTSIDLDTRSISMWGGLGRFMQLLNDIQPSRPCSALPQQLPQFIFWGGYLNATPDSTPANYQLVLEQAHCAAVVCAPTARLGKTRVLDNGITPELTLLPQANPGFIKANPWLMATQWLTLDIREPIGLQSPIESWLTTKKGGRSVDISSLKNDLLEAAIVEHSNRLTQLAVHLHLRRDDSHIVQGSRVMTFTKIMVNRGVSLALMTLSALSSVILVILIYASHYDLRIWHRDPGTVLGNILFLSEGRNEVALDGHTDSEHPNKAKLDWACSHYTPLILRSWARSALVVFTSGLIVVLAYSLNRSETSNGLTDVTDDGYLSVLWTSAPIVIMLIISLSVSSADTALRDRAILNELSTRGCSVKDIDTCLLDILGIRSLYSSFQLKHYTTDLTQSLSLACSFLTMLSALLLAVQPIPRSTTLALRQQSWFGAKQTDADARSSDEYGDLRKASSTFLFLLHSTNFTYPENTYGDLIFPQFERVERPTTRRSDFSIKLQVPAARLQPNCVQLHEHEGFLIMIEKDDEGNIVQFKDGHQNWEVTRNVTCPNGVNVTLSERFLTTPPIDQETGSSGTSHSYFLRNLRHNDDQEPSECGIDVPNNYHSISWNENHNQSYYWREHIYIWGSYSSPQRAMDHLAVFQCNYTWYEVMTEVQLIWKGDQMVFDPLAPPVANTSSTRPWDPQFPVPGAIEHIPEKGVPEEQDPIFQTIKDLKAIFEPHGLMSVEDLKDPTRNVAILEALNQRTTLKTAQIANVEDRLPIDQASVTEPFRPGFLPILNGTIVDSGRQRLTQDSTITYTIMLILLLVVFVNFLAILSTLLRVFGFGRRPFLFDLSLRGIAPEDFSSVSCMEALLEGSNIFEMLPEDAHLMSTAKIYETLEGKRFRMGWFRRTEPCEDVFTIGVLDDDNLIFLGSKQDFKKMEVSKT